MRDGFVYGLDEGILACLDLKTGRIKWKGGHYEYGQVLLLENVLLVIAENGDLALVEISPGRRPRNCPYPRHRRQNLEPPGHQRQPPLRPQRRRGRLLRPRPAPNRVPLTQHQSPKADFFGFFGRKRATFLGSTPKNRTRRSTGRGGMESSSAAGLLTPSPLAPYGRGAGMRGPRRREQGGLAGQNKGTFLGSTPKKAKMAAAPPLPFFPSPPSAPSPRSQAPAWERTPRSSRFAFAGPVRNPLGIPMRRKKRSVESCVPKRELGNETQKSR